MDCYLRKYLSVAPVALSVERSLECVLMARRPFVRPILDLGCGDGLFASRFADFQIDFGLDCNARELSAAREHRCYRQLVQCRGEHFPIGTGTVATVFSNSVVEHIKGVDIVMREVFRVLAPGGILYLTVPTDLFERYFALVRLLSTVRMRSAAAWLARSYNSFWQHHHAYPVTRWKSVLQDAGLHVQDVEEYGSGFTCTFNDLMAPLAFPSFLTKKILNRWVLIPALRRLVAPALSLLVSPVTRSKPTRGEGGLVFIAAQKSRGEQKCLST